MGGGCRTGRFASFDESLARRQLPGVQPRARSANIHLLEIVSRTLSWLTGFEQFVSASILPAENLIPTRLTILPSQIQRRSNKFQDPKSCKVAKLIIVSLTALPAEGDIENIFNFSDAIRDFFLERFTKMRI
jgi:hypothetical protein